MTAQVLALSLRLGARKGLSEPVHILGSAGILAALVISYGRILQALPMQDMARLGFSHGQVIWYLVVTETIFMGSGRQFREMQDTIRGGAIETMLLRPVEFWPLTLAGWCGEHFARLCLLAPFALVLGACMTGFVPVRAILLLLILSIMLAIVMLMASFLIIGCTSLWLGESRPVYFLYQKLVFLLGGLLWPLAFYPAWMAGLAHKTAFPAMIATPGGFMLGEARSEILQDMALQILWTAVFMALCAATEKAVRNRVVRQGG